MEIQSAVVGRWHRLRGNSLYLNSITLMASTAVMALLGFLYWLIVARLYSPRDVGLASTLVSVMTYIGLASQLGLNVGIIRYLADTKKAAGIVASSFAAVSASSVIVSAFSLWGLKSLSGKLSMLTGSSIVGISFLVFMVFAAINVTMESVFIALRRSYGVLIKNTLLSILKITLVSLFIGTGAYGIFSAWGIAIVVSVVVSYTLLPVNVRTGCRVELPWPELREMAIFSVGNYAANLIGNLSLATIPVILTVLAGPTVTAHYAIAMSYATLLFSVPISVCSSLLAEGTFNERDISAHTVKAIKLIAAILLPGILLILAFGKAGLALFGREYSANSVQLLSLLALSSVFVAINTVCWTLLNLKRKVAAIVLVLALNAGLVLTSIVVAAGYGLSSVGLGWMIGQGITSAVYLGLTRRHYSLRSANPRATKP